MRSVATLATAAACVSCLVAWWMSWAGPPTENASRPFATGNVSKVFTVEELAQYSEKKKGDTILIAILGDVFDVTSGRRFYGAKQDYGHFAGRDASKAFVTGNTEGDDLTDDVSTLSVDELESIASWHDFYIKHENYTWVGHVIGRHFDATGQALNAFPWEALAKRKKATEERKRQLPDCNSKWTAKTGSEVWCTTKSGGVEREWVGTPRLYKPALDPLVLDLKGLEGRTSGADDSVGQRCVCVPPQQVEDWASVAFLVPYDGCDLTADTCKVVKKQIK